MALKKARLGMVLTAVAMALSACGGAGGGSGDAASANVAPMVDSFGSSMSSSFDNGVDTAQGADGTAGDGAAIANAAVTIADSAHHSVTVNTDAHGIYHARIDGFVPPFVAFVQKPNGSRWYAPSIDAPKKRGFITINLTGLTDQIASDVAFTAGSTGSASLTPAMLQNNPAALAQAKDKLRTILASNLAAAGLDASSFDPVSSPFLTNSTGYDLVLDQLTVSNGTALATTILAKTKSADQLAFETFRLSGTSSHLFWSLPATGTALAGTSYLYASSASLAASPSAGAIELTQTGPVNLVNIALPASATIPSRFVVNGSIYADSFQHDLISYQSTGVTDTILDQTGTTAVEVLQFSNFSNVALSGSLAASPTELITYFSPLLSNTRLLNTAATWQTGAQYERRTGVFANDTYFVTDYNGSTTGTTPNPVPGGTTIASLMAAGGINANDNGTTVKYTSSMGTVSTINGVTTYIANATVANGGANTRYRTFYEIGGNVYIGSLHKAGAPTDSTGYTVRLNAAALASIQAALLF